MSGTFTGIVIVLRDITERKLAEDALKQVLTKLNLLSSITRHDILNQVSALKMYLELSRMRVTDPDTDHYLLQTQKIADVIDRQISFTRDYEEMGATAPVWQEWLRVSGNPQTSLPLGCTRVSSRCREGSRFLPTRSLKRFSIT